MQYVTHPICNSKYVFYICSMFSYASLGYEKGANCTKTNTRIFQSLENSTPMKKGPNCTESKLFIVKNTITMCEKAQFRLKWLLNDSMDLYVNL